MGCTKQEYELELEQKQMLFEELNVKEKLSKTEVLKILVDKPRDFDLNYESVEGNRTQPTLYMAFLKIVDATGHGTYDLNKLNAREAKELVDGVFEGMGYNVEILNFNPLLDNPEFENQSSYRLWHLLYSFEGDDSKTGNEKLVNKICETFGFVKEYAKILAEVALKDDYGSLSAKAIRKILPHLKDGLKYDAACMHTGYRHSKSSLNKEELDNKVLKEKLALLPKNSLRNPVVEKILNQLVNVINSVIEAYGKPDEIRIELARELKKSAAERESLTQAMTKTTAEHEEYRRILHKEFGLKYVSKNDIIRYKLYIELKDNGFKTLYSNTYIPQEKLFSKEFDIEHIIPQSRLFDDSFSNKTLEKREINIEKGNETAYDFVLAKYGKEGMEQYLQRIEQVFKNSPEKRTKVKKLKMKGSEIPDDFIAREICDTQYIAKKAKTMLEELVRDVVSTGGSITDRLRQDWQLIDVMKELNREKYNKLGLTEIVENKDGQRIYKIKDWTKRNDHRHHALDALTVAFTKRSIIQYLNNLNARSDKSGSIYGIMVKETYKDKDGKILIKPPMPLETFRAEAKKHLEYILVSIKAKNKVVTVNINTTKKKDGVNKKRQLTPRGQLHNETIYGSSKFYSTKEEKVGSSFTVEVITTVSKKCYREALLKRLQEFDNDPTKAFTGKNSLAKNPLWIDEHQSHKVPEKVKTVRLEELYTIRKDISPDLKIDKVVDVGVRNVLQRKLDRFGGDSKKAFSNLDENPIFINPEKKIPLKRVTITGVSNAIALHDKRDKEGRLLHNPEGKKQPVDFVNTDNNHHAAIFSDSDGNLQEVVVSFYEAVERARQGLPIVDKNFRKEDGWQFLFSIKQNECFVFPNEKTGLNPKEIDLQNPVNYTIISPNLFRVQSFSTKDYVFRHHLETILRNDSKLKDILFYRVRSLNRLAKIVKVRINHIGQIETVGEY